MPTHTVGHRDASSPASQPSWIHISLNLKPSSPGMLIHAPTGWTKLITGTAAALLCDLSNLVAFLSPQRLNCHFLKTLDKKELYRNNWNFSCLRRPFYFKDNDRGAAKNILLQHRQFMPDVWFIITTLAHTHTNTHPRIKSAEPSLKTFQSKIWQEARLLVTGSLQPYTPSWPLRKHFSNLHLKATRVDLTNYILFVYTDSDNLS